MTQTLVLTIDKRLDTPNRNRGGHWSKRHRETKEWEQAIAIAGERRRVWDLFERAEVVKGKIRSVVRKERRRVEVERHVARAQDLIHDDDNLAYATKPVLDALKRLHLITDDRRTWLDKPPTVQRVSGKDFTVIRITRETI